MKCPVCNEDVDESSENATKHNGIWYHLDCLSSWLKRNGRGKES